jgi:Chaperone of endosialidase
MKTTIVISLAFLCLSGAGPNAQAVVPPPDGGYPNFTTAEGTKALQSLTTGVANTAVGWFSLFANSTGGYNTAVGAGALDLNAADNNTATGAAALLLNTTGNNNTANGTDALVYNDSGSFNTAVGIESLFYNTTGGQNTAVGRDALANNTTGSHNIALGSSAGVSLVTGDYNIDIGNFGVFDEADTIRIGDGDRQTATYIAGISGVVVPGGVTVIIDSNGHVGTVVSSQRFKDQIKPMDKASEAIFALKPVTFRYKQKIDPKGIPQFGLVAEEVEKVNPDLVVRDKEGKPYSVRYDQVNAMLLNEFLKEHRKVQEQEMAITQLKKDFDSTIAQFTARLHGQAEQIQKVNAQLEASKPAPQVVANN